jgi:hypothetical protein
MRAIRAIKAFINSDGAEITVITFLFLLIHKDKRSIVSANIDVLIQKSDLLLLLNTIQHEKHPQLLP